MMPSPSTGLILLSLVAAAALAANVRREVVAGPAVVDLTGARWLLDSFICLRIIEKIKPKNLAEIFYHGNI